MYVSARHRKLNDEFVVDSGLSGLEQVGATCIMALIIGCLAIFGVISFVWHQFPRFSG